MIEQILDTNVRHSIQYVIVLNSLKWLVVQLLLSNIVTRTF